MSSVLRSDSTLAYMPQSDPLLAAASHTGVSWAAALAGAVTAAALSLVLLVLGVGLGLSGVSPWANHGMSAGAMGISTIIWLAFTQIAASGVGGYLAGRLRTHWSRLHTDEVYFRDTAQGLLSWSLATLATAFLMGSAISNAVGTGVSAGATVASSMGAAADVITSPSTSTTEASMSDPAGAAGYWIDALLRTDPSTATATAEGLAPPPSPADATELAATRAEAARIVLHGLAEGTLSPSDTTYLGRMVAKRNGMTQAVAEVRVKDVFASVKKSLADAAIAVREKADQARKAAAYSSLWMFVALLAGAFVAAVCATFGGRRRDEMVVRT